jgi:hypothetical protein
MLPPFELYIQGTDQRMHTVVVPSSEPEVSALSWKSHTCMSIHYKGSITGLSTFFVVHTHIYAHINTNTHMHYN